MVREQNKAAGYQDPEISTTFLKNAILCYMPQLPYNNKRVQDIFFTVTLVFLFGLNFSAAKTTGLPYGQSTTCLPDYNVFLFHMLPCHFCHGDFSFLGHSGELRLYVCVYVWG